ncbi:glycosyltransferase [Moritella sp. Urea-trap-13]|uniref:glycosyltransferase n=1 Tax=Moritella sp. Urea-trap-13 TaxID=2058327 RepID=UPI000C34E744|nr:glycosyltransferase [Moritella sp. Urea-trap-13]PKH07503.1 glycosyltransferase [Moritella sp. Urea-trap-13]
MKILHVIESGGFYGAERVLIELMLGLKVLGHEVTLLSVGYKGQEDKEFEIICRQSGIAVNSIRVTKLESLCISRYIKDFAEEHDFDVVHSHGYKFNILFGLMPKRNRSKCFCATVHGYVSAPKFSKMALYQYLDKYSLKQLNRVFLVSQHMTSLASIQGLEVNQYTVIENGIGGYVPKCAIEERLVTFLHNKTTRLMAVGRLAVEKSFDTLIDALPQLIENDPNTVLVIFGAGSEEYRLRKKINQLDLNEHVLLFGFVESLSSYFNHFDVFVMPSITEGTPIALLEAMLARVPCVVTNVGGMPHMLGHGKGGWIVPPKDSLALQIAISESLIQSQSQIKTIFSYERATYEFNYLHMSQQYLNEYQSLLSANSLST